MDINLESVLLKRFSNVAEERTEATEYTKKLRKNANSYLQFLEVASTSGDHHVRQAAIIDFHSMLTSKKLWFTLPDATREQIKRQLVDRINLEQNTKVKRIVVQSAGRIALYELYPLLFEYIETSLSSEDRVLCNEVGMFVLCVLSEYHPKLFESYMVSLISYISKVLNNKELAGTALAYLSVITFKNFIENYDEPLDWLSKSAESHIDAVLYVARMQCVRSRPERTTDCLTYFEALFDRFPKVVVRNSIRIVEGLVDLVITMNVESVVQKVFCVMSLIVCSKTKKVVQNVNLLDSLLMTVFRILFRPLPVKLDQFEFTSDGDSLVNGAVALMGTLTTVINTELLISRLLPIMESVLSKNDVYCQKSVYITLGVLVENCPEEARCLIDRISSFTEQGLKSNEPISINGAIYLLARFTENMKHDGFDSANKFLPDLIDTISNLKENPKQLQYSSINSVFAIMHLYCEHLESGMMPYMDQLVSVLIQNIQNSDVKYEIRLSCMQLMDDLITAVGTRFRPYSSTVLNVVMYFLQEELSDDWIGIQAESYVVLGNLFQLASRDNPAEMATVSESLAQATNRVARRGNSELRAGFYKFVKGCAEMLRELPDELLVPVFSLMATSFENEANDDTSTARDEIVDGVIYGDEEKEEALITLGSLAQSLGGGFQRYLKECYVLAWKMMFHRSCIVRAAAVDAISRMQCAIHKFPELKAVELPLDKCRFVGSFHMVLHEDSNVDVVHQVLSGLQSVLAVDPNFLMEPANTKADPPPVFKVIASMIRTVLTEKTRCQYHRFKKKDDESDDDESSISSDYDDNYTPDDLLIEAEDLIPTLGKLLPQKEFVTSFNKFQTYLFKLLKKSVASDVRNNTSATMALCAQYLGEEISPFAVEFASVFQTLMHDSNDLLRNNVAFCLAQMILHGKSAMYTYYNAVIASLVMWLRSEDADNVLDNICGAIASMIVTNKNLLPLNDIVPIYFEHLPLRADLEEMVVIVKSFTVLLSDEYYKNWLQRAVHVIFGVKPDSMPNFNEIRTEVRNFFQQMLLQYRNELVAILNDLPQDMQSYYILSYGTLS